MQVLLTSKRKKRFLAGWFMAAVSSALIFISAIEPLRAIAAEQSDDVIVTLVVGSTIVCTCTTPISMGSINGTGDTDSSGFNAARATNCTVDTNNASGYSLAWKVESGTGALGARTGTGHLGIVSALIRPP